MNSNTEITETPIQSALFRSFSIEVFPKWLQPISRALPLTHLNTAMRNVAFEGQNLWDVRSEIGILLLWSIAVYFVAVKVFKWE